MTWSLVWVMNARWWRKKFIHAQRVLELLAEFSKLPPQTFFRIKSNSRHFNANWTWGSAGEWLTDYKFGAAIDKNENFQFRLCTWKLRDFHESPLLRKKNGKSPATMGENGEIGVDNGFAIVCKCHGDEQLQTKRIFVSVRERSEC